jgi:hypothetical protein
MRRRLPAHSQPPNVFPAVRKRPNAPFPAPRSRNVHVGDVPSRLCASMRTAFQGRLLGEAGYLPQCRVAHCGSGSRTNTERLSMGYVMAAWRSVGHRCAREACGVMTLHGKRRVADGLVGATG